MRVLFQHAVIILAFMMWALSLFCYVYVLVFHCYKFVNQNAVEADIVNNMPERHA